MSDDKELIESMIRQAVVEAGGNAVEARKRVTTWLESLILAETFQQISRELSTRKMLFNKESLDAFHAFTEKVVREPENHIVRRRFIQTLSVALDRWIGMECESFRQQQHT